MSKPVVAVVVCTLLALVAAVSWVPSYHQWSSRDGLFTTSTHYEYRTAWRVRWALGPGSYGSHNTTHNIHWPALLGTQAVILLLGGGLLTVMVRRERRRTAKA